MADPNELDIRKALDTGAVSTGAVLVPERIEPGIRLMVETRSPLWAMLPKRQAEGMTWNWKELTGLPVASFGAELGALPAATNSTFADKTTPIKSIYVRGELSGQLIAATRNVMNIVSDEVNRATIGMIRVLEDTIISGDSGVNVNKFDGLVKQITNVLHNDTVGDGSGTDQPLSLAALNALVDFPAGGEPTHFIFGKPMSRKLWSLVQGQIRYINANSADAGFQVPAYGDKPIIRLFDNAAALANRIIAIEQDKIYVPLLQDITYEEVGKTRDSRDFFLKCYLTLVVEGAARHHAMLEDVTSTIA